MFCHNDVCVPLLPSHLDFVQPLAILSLAVPFSIYPLFSCPIFVHPPLTGPLSRLSHLSSSSVVFSSAVPSSSHPFFTYSTLQLSPLQLSPLQLFPLKLFLVQLSCLQLSPLRLFSFHLSLLQLSPLQLFPLQLSHFQLSQACFLLSSGEILCPGSLARSRAATRGPFLPNTDIPGWGLAEAPPAWPPAGAGVLPGLVLEVSLVGRLRCVVLPGKVSLSRGAERSPPSDGRSL